MLATTFDLSARIFVVKLLASVVDDFTLGFSSEFDWNLGEVVLITLDWSPDLD